MIIPDDLIQQLTPIYYEFLRTICRIETPSDNKAALDKLASCIKQFAIDCGFSVHRFPFSRSGDFLLISLDGDKTLDPILLMAHMDTVHPVGSFGPKVIWEEGDWLHGPGTVDCKGGITTALMTMDVLQHIGCRRPVSLLLTSDEEISGRLSGSDGFDLMKRYASKACAVFNCETGKDGEMTVGRKGIVRLQVTVTGRPSHAGNAYFLGASAIREAANQILQIESNSSENGCTFNCGTICGGTTPNTVPGSCSFVVDIRSKETSILNQGVEQVKNLTKCTSVSGTSCQTTVISTRPPMEHFAKNDELLEKINRSAIALGLQPLRGIIRGGGSDAAYTVQTGVPTVCSCGMTGSGEHTLSEKVKLSSLPERVSLLVHTICSL